MSMHATTLFTVIGIGLSLEFPCRVCWKWVYLWSHPQGTQTTLTSSEVEMGKWSSRRYKV